MVAGEGFEPSTSGL